MPIPEHPAASSFPPKGEPHPLKGMPTPSAAYMASREAWDRAYDEAMQWRDWQTCEQMIEEREQAEWWTPEEAMLDE